MSCAKIYTDIQDYVVNFEVFFFFFSPLWSFDPIPAQVASRSLIGYTTVGWTFLDE